MKIPRKIPRLERDFRQQCGVVVQAARDDVARAVLADLQDAVDGIDRDFDALLPAVHGARRRCLTIAASFKHPSRQSSGARSSPFPLAGEAAPKARAEGCTAACSQHGGRSLR